MPGICVGTCITEFYHKFSYHASHHLTVIAKQMCFKAHIAKTQLCSVCVPYSLVTVQLVVNRLCQTAEGKANDHRGVRRKSQSGWTRQENQLCSTGMENNTYVLSPVKGPFGLSLWQLSIVMVEFRILIRTVYNNAHYAVRYPLLMTKY